MHNLLRFYRQNSRKIWTVLLFAVLAFGILQYLNYVAKQQVNNEQIRLQLIQNSSSSNTTTNPTENGYAVVSETGVSPTETEQNKNVIDSFIEYCNKKDVTSAYNLLTAECKEKLFPTLQAFRENYYSKIFTENRIYDMETWIADKNFYTYKVEIKEDILSSGGKMEGGVFTDYYTILWQEDGKQELNINSYVGRRNIGTSNSAENISIKILSKDVYMDYEIYNIEVTNNTDGSILLDSKQKSRNSFSYR